MKKKNAFTLVELIAIMVIIGVISVIVLPQVKSNAYNKKLKQYDNIVTTIENAAKMYHIKNTDQSRIYLDELIGNDYLSSNLINPITKNQLVGCVIVNVGEDGITNYEYLSDNASCAEYTSYVTLVVNLNGGSTIQTFNNQYISGSILNITNPTRTGFTFNGWSITGTNASINENSLTIGSDETTLTANWNIATYSISYNLNGGNVTPANPVSYNIETNPITLTNPTKTGYTFAGWTGSNGTTPQTTVTIQKGSTGNKSYTANWTPSFILVTINGAINETITYSGTDSGTISTDSTGTATATLKIGTYTFTSNVAKTITNVSAYYSKTVTIDGSTSIVNFYPAGAIYWYGNGDDFGEALYSVSGGFEANDYHPAGLSVNRLYTASITTYTNYIQFAGAPTSSTIYRLHKSYYVVNSIAKGSYSTLKYVYRHSYPTAYNSNSFQTSVSIANSWTNSYSPVSLTYLAQCAASNPSSCATNIVSLNLSSASSTFKLNTVVTGYHGSTNNIQYVAVDAIVLE